MKTLAVEYPKEDGKAIVPFEVANATFTLAKENLNLSLGTTGANWTLEKVTSGTPAVGKTIRYNIVLTNVKSSGVVAGAVMNPNTKQIINISSGQVQAQVIYESVYKAPKEVKALLGTVMNYVTFNDKPCVELLVACNLDKMSASNIILQTNTCGAVVESFELDKTSLGKPVAGMYKLTISVKTPGAFSFSIKAPSGDRVEIVSNATLEAKFAKKTVSDKFLSPTFNVTEAEIKKVTPAKVKDLHFKGGSSEIEGMLKKDSDLKLDDSKLQTLPKVEDPKVTNPKLKGSTLKKP